MNENQALANAILVILISSILGTLVSLRKKKNGKFFDWRAEIGLSITICLQLFYVYVYWQNGENYNIT